MRATPDELPISAGVMMLSAGSSAYSSGPRRYLTLSTRAQRATQVKGTYATVELIWFEGGLHVTRVVKRASI